MNLASTAATLGAVATVASAYQNSYYQDLSARSLNTYYQDLAARGLEPYNLLNTHHRRGWGSAFSGLGRSGSSAARTGESAIGRTGSTLGREGAGTATTAAQRTEQAAAREHAAGAPAGATTPGSVPNVPQPGPVGSTKMDKANMALNVAQTGTMVGMMAAPPHPPPQAAAAAAPPGGNAPTAPTPPGARKRDVYGLEEELGFLLGKRDALAQMEEELAGLLYAREAEAMALAEADADAFYEVLFGRDAEAEPEADDD